MRHHNETNTRLIRRLLAAVLCGASALLAQTESKPSLVTRLSFGVYTSERASTMYDTFAPALAEIAAATGAALLRPVRLELKVYKTYEEALDAFTRGEVDVVRFGPASYVLAKQRNPGIQLVVAEQEDGQKRCKGVFVVRADSPIQCLAELAGKKVAFGDDSSTIGRFLAQAELVKAGVHARDLKEFKYLGRHDKVAKAVELGDFDAGPVHIATLESIDKKHEKLRVIATFDNAGKPWLAREGLDAKTVGALRTALLAMKTPKSLDVLKVHGFLPADESDYDLVRKGMKKAEEFERDAGDEPGRPSVPPRGR